MTDYRDPADALIGLCDATASMLERAASAILTPDADLPALAAVLRETAAEYRAKARPPLVEAEVRRVGARLRVGQDPRAVFPGLGRDLHAGGGAS